MFSKIKPMHFLLKSDFYNSSIICRWSADMVILLAVKEFILH